MLSQVVALQTIGGKLFDQKTDISGAPQSKLSKDDLLRASMKAQIQEKLDLERKQNALFNLFSSPLGRFYLVFHRLIGGAPIDGSERGQLLQMARKAELPITQQMLELQQTLQTLSRAYLKTSVGKRDLILIAAAV